MKIDIKKLSAEVSDVVVPSYLSRVAAGFPSPADDYVEDGLDLNHYLVKKPAATFVARAQGNSMVRLGIFDQDLLVIDRSVEAGHGHVVVAAINGEMVCKVLDKHRQRLLSGNDSYPPIEINDDLDLVIEGVVTFSVRHHHVRPG